MLVTRARSDSFASPLRHAIHPPRAFRGVEARTLRSPSGLITQHRIPHVAIPHRDEKLLRNAVRHELVMRKSNLGHGNFTFAQAEEKFP